MLQLLEVFCCEGNPGLTAKQVFWISFPEYPEEQLSDNPVFARIITTVIFWDFSTLVFFSISLYLKIHLLCKQGCGMQVALCVWGSNQEDLKPWQETSSSSQQQNIARKFPDLWIILISSMQDSPVCLQVRKLQLLNHMPCSAYSTYFSKTQLRSSGWHWDDNAELKSKAG